MSYCEFCGAKLEEGQACTCPLAGQVRARAASPAPQPDHPPFQAEKTPQQQEGTPPQPPTGHYPPPSTQSFSQGYPPPPQGAFPPPPYYGAPPHGYSPYGAQPGYYGAPPGAYPNQYTNQAHQALDAVHNTLGSFLKDPYGMAAKGGSLSASVSMILLGVQAVAFFLMVLGEMAKFRFIGTDVGFWVKTALLGAVGIALLYGCLFITGKIARIPLNPKTLLSAQALSSLPLSMMYILTAVFVLAFDGNISVFLQALVQTLGSVASILLLEVSLRAIMPAGVGNMSRMVTLICACALTNGLAAFFSMEMVYQVFPFFF